MGTVKRSTLLGLGLLLLSTGACKVSCTTANISSLKFSKDKAGTVQTKDFAPGDTIVATATVSNNPSKVALKFRLFAEQVKGQQENTHIPNFDLSLDLSNDGRGTYTLIPPPAGWPTGRYRVEVAMMVDGEQKDQKVDTFTVTGGSGAEAPPSPAATSTPTGDGHSENNANEEEDSNSPGDK